MKNIKKLIPAFCMLLVSVVLLGSSTYAWFTMNQTVRASGMNVTAKSNETYLLIGDDAAKAANAKTDSADVALTNAHAAAYTTVGNNEKKCYPTAYYAEEGTLNGHTTEAGKWYTTNSNNKSAAVSGTAAITEVTLGAADYMLTYKMYLTLSKDSQSYTGDVTITANWTDADAAVKAYVTINGEVALFDATTTTFTTENDVTISATTAVEVVVYVYIDGNSENVNSAYLAGGNTITGELGLTFDITL